MQPESTSIVFRRDLQEQVREYDVDAAMSRFIGRQAAPIFKSAVSHGRYPLMNRENFKKRTPDSRAPGGAYNRITGKFGQGTFTTEEHGLEEALDRRDRELYSLLFDTESESVTQLWYQIMLNHEYRVAQLYANGGFTEASPFTVWSTAGSAVPLTDLETGMKSLRDKCGAGGNEISLIIPWADYLEMVRTTQVNDKLKYTYRIEGGIQPAMIKPRQVADMLGIKSVLVGDSVLDSTEEGVAESISQIWTAGTVYLAVLCAENAALKRPSAARTILWTDYIPEFPLVESYEEPKVNSDVVRVRLDTDEVLIGETDLFVYALTT